MTNEKPILEPDTPEAKRETLARLLREKAGREVIQPLSHGQVALWLVHEMDPQSPAYNVSVTVRMGAVDIRALQRTLAGLASRHEMLRSRYTAEGGEPVARIAPSIEVPFEEVDVQGLTHPGLEARVVAASAVPFDLAKGPIFRAGLFRTGVDENVLLITVHHIAFDGWSMGVLMADLVEIYSAERDGRKAALEPLPARYSDFTRWLDERVRSPEGEKLWEYWRERLKGPLPTLDLPTDRPRPAAQSFRGATHTFRIEASLADKLRELAKRHGTTAYTVLYAVFTTLLHRYTGQHDIIIGSPTVGRSRREFEGLVGYFVNPVVLRGDLSGDLTFLEHLERSRTLVLDALHNADFPFPILVQRLNPARDVSRSPLFQLDFNVLKTGQLGTSTETSATNSVLRVTGKGMDLEVLNIRQQEGQFDLSFELYDTGTTFIGNLKYATDLFDADRIVRMAGHFEQLARSVVERPSARVSELGYLTEQESETLRRWNDSPSVEDGDRRLHVLFEQQVDRSPDAEAVLWGTESTTYEQLDAASNRLARRLSRLGVGPGVLVGVCMERSTALVVTLYAILKAGGAYVPLDPAYPPERVAFMLEDSRAVLLVTTSTLAERWLQQESSRLVVDDPGETERIGEESSDRLGHTGSERDLAYVIYTSGSTGKPKGVAIEHRSAGTLVRWARTVFSADELRGVLASTSVCFDLSVFEIFFPLASGGRIVIADNALALAHMEARDKVTLLNTVPSAAVELVRAEAIPHSVTTVCLAGEPLSTSLVNDLYATGTIQRVYDLYGPSEDTTYSTYTLRQQGAPATIGRPIAETQAYILDTARQSVAVGVVGELYLAGSGLARGYLNRPELTEERFVANPFGAPGERMYYTGDLARFRSDGQIEFLGRRDHQVKIRGYRIELEEIEVALRSNPGIDQAVVVAQAAADGDHRLVAYLTEATGVAPNVTELRAHLRKTLPTYMVPSTFVTLDRLPLTPNGKVDRKVLVALDSSPATRVATLPPQTPMEQYLAGQWQDLLGVANVGLRDNFFDLGGHSLLAMRVLAAIEKRTGKRLHPRDIIFQNLEQLAHACGELREERNDEEAEVSRGGRLRSALRGLIPGRAKS